MKFKGEHYRRCYRYFRRDSREGDLNGRGEPVDSHYMVVVDLKGLPTDEDNRVSRKDINAAPQTVYAFSTRTNQCYTVTIRTARSAQRMSWSREDEGEWEKKLVEPGEQYIEYRTFLAYDGVFWSNSRKVKATPEKLKMWLEQEAALRAAIASKNLEAARATS